MIAGIVIVLIGVLIHLYARKLNRPFEEYEFQNRTDGGVVKFESLKASKRHHLKKNLVSILGGIGILVGALGLVILMFVFSFGGP